MVESEKNARRSDEAERSRHISATESVAFATMLLGLLNDSDTALHRLEHEGEARAAEPAALQPHPAEASVAPAPTDAGLAHDDQHASTIDAPPPDISPAIHNDASATFPSQEASLAVDDASSIRAVATEITTSSSAPSSFTASIDHPTSVGASSAPAGGTAPALYDLGASVHTVADTVTGIVDTALATVWGTIASLTATVTQVTSTVSDTVSHLTDGLLGTISGSAHDAPSTGVVEPLAANLLSQALSPIDTGTHGISLLDTAGAIPTSLLHPMPLQLGFLGQPTMDGHEPHDGAFSALGIHHF